MKKLILIFLVIFGFSAVGCAEENGEVDEKMEEIKIKITVGDKIMNAALLNNETTKELISKFPMTVQMDNLFAREMCYNFPTALPAKDARRGGYEVGDISYWPPSKSFVIFYKQNGEIINLQKIGRVDPANPQAKLDGVEIFEHTGDTRVTFELMN